MKLQTQNLKNLKRGNTEGRIADKMQRKCRGRYTEEEEQKTT